MIPVVSAYAKAKNYVEYHSQLTEQEMIQLKKKNPGVTLTISRQSGIDTNILCTKLDENFSDYYQTNWVYFDKELFEKVISDHNLPPRIQKFLTEQKVPAFSQMLNELLGIHPPIRKLIHKMASTILNLAEIGNVILIGRGANVISANLKNAYHVRLVAPLEERINFYLETTDVSRPVIPLLISKTAVRLRPASITILIPSIVRLVSAMSVDNTIFRMPSGTGLMARSCSSKDSIP